MLLLLVVVWIIAKENICSLIMALINIVLIRNFLRVANLLIVSEVSKHIIMRQLLMLETTHHITSNKVLRVINLLVLVLSNIQIAHWFIYLGYWGYLLLLELGLLLKLRWLLLVHLIIIWIFSFLCEVRIVIIFKLWSLMRSVLNFGVSQIKQFCKLFRPFVLNLFRLRILA